MKQLRRRSVPVMPSITRNNSTAGMQALGRLRSTEPPQWLAPNSELSKTSRLASEYLFSCLQPYAIKCPFDKLLTEGFDAEQIWQQIDLQAQPLLSTLRREVNKLEKNPEEIKKMRLAAPAKNDENLLEGKGFGQEDERDSDYGDDLDMDDMEGSEEDDDEHGDDENEDGEGNEEEMKEGENEGVEDKFLKMNELEKFLKEDEAREYGTKSKKKRRVEKEDDEDDDEEDGNYEELVAFDGDSEDGDADARYDDFFGAVKEKASVKKPKFAIDSSSDEEEEESEEEGESEDEGEDEGLFPKASRGPTSKDKDEDVEEKHPDDDNAMEDKKKRGSISTHEKQLAKIQAEIKEMEKANLDPKTWTMQGEVTAVKRPKNSALEVDLDFEHNMRPAPMITEQVTASLESMILQRIVEVRFDDVQKAPSIASKAPRELKELDENKSKKGLAEVYEDEFVKKSDPTNAPLSFLDELEKEGELMWKRISLKLDALSHFHFAPKPVIEDMSIQANVPALAMEEIAPVAVSDAAMLAPEEVFSGKGDIKEEVELTKEERKTRRANKKRKFKTAKIVKKPQYQSLVNGNDGKDKEVAV